MPVLTKRGVKHPDGQRKPSKSQNSEQNSTPFLSPPLLPGFISALSEITDKPSPHATNIQQLAISNVLEHIPACPDAEPEVFASFLKERWKAKAHQVYKQYLLASETGSGKSIAYMLPVLQSVKLDELAGWSPPVPPKAPPLNPRAIILAPTHELSRQLATFAKALLHNVKLRIVCASKANLPTREGPSSSADSFVDRRKSTRAMKNEMDYLMGGNSSRMHIVPDISHEADVVVATPMKALEMIRGRGWERTPSNPLRDGEQRLDPDGAKTVAKPELGCSRIDWVVIDEADVLFGRFLSF